MNLLFVCNQGVNRSRTAELLFRDKFKTRSVGLYGDRLISEEDMMWADVVLVMEEWQIDELAKRFPSQYLAKRILCLDVPDVYSLNDPRLKEVLRAKFSSIQTIL